MIGEDPAALIVQNDRRQGINTFDLSFALKKTEFSKFIHD